MKVERTLLAKSVQPTDFIARAIRAVTVLDVETLLAQLPITPQDEYTFDEEKPEEGWRSGNFHWIPVGRDRGNAGRIKLAHKAVNPIAERTINGMEAIIELARQRELAANPSAVPPATPRDAVNRYFGLPPLDSLPKLDNSERSKEVIRKARDLARQLRVRLIWDKREREFTVAVEDDGIGQPPQLIHRTLLSLGSTTKADKPYLIGIFGQGGSSAYSVCKYSWLVSRSASDISDEGNDGAGWTVIKQIFPKGRRDPYFAYLACDPEGRVPFISRQDAESAKIRSGTRFVHVAWNFGKGGSAITRQLFRSLNHVLYNPVLPFELYAQRDTADVIYGNAYRLSLLGNKSGSGPAPARDKMFPPQIVTAR